MIPSTATIEALLDGAMQQFTRHGFAKTSMSDIAKASGVSRTSLYNAFPTKDDVFRALSSRINQRVHAAVVSAFGRPGAWDERMLDIINARVSWVYELLHASEYGRELINEKNKICGGDVLAANDRFEKVIANLLTENLTRPADGAALARVLIQSVNGILEKAETKAGAEQSIALLVGVFCAGATKADAVA
jgi:AcrR family transcriptional regulator